MGTSENNLNWKSEKKEKSWVLKKFYMNFHLKDGLGRI